MRRIGVYGGTFDPIHIGHLVAAAEVQHVLGLDRVLFLPAGEPPHKTNNGMTAARIARGWSSWQLPTIPTSP